MSRSNAPAWSVAAVLISAAAATGAGCGDGPSRPEADPILAATATASAVDLLVIGCRVEPVHGTGAIVTDAEGGTWILTAGHVVAGATSIVITTADRTQHAVNGTLVALDPANDLALLRSPLTGPALELAGQLADAGDSGAVVVFDDGTATALGYEITSRASVNIDDIYGDERGKRSGYRVDVEIELGDSGAVLVDAAGQAAGVLYAKSLATDDSAFATDITSISALFADAAGVDADRGIDTGACPAT